MLEGLSPPLLTPIPPTLSLLLFTIGAIQLQWIMPISLLGNNKTIGFSDIVEVCILLLKKNFFKLNFRKKMKCNHPYFLYFM